LENKRYIIVQSQEQYEQFLAHIKKYDYFAFDTETTGLNVRKDRVIGFSVCGDPSESFYFPLETWIASMDRLEPVWSKEDAIYILNLLKEKELIMWNGSYDIRIVKNYFGIDLTDSLLVEGMLLKHTLEEEGDFALKKVAIQNQKALGFDAEAAANQEQIELKENVKKNGGSTTKNNYEMYKADLDVMGKYAASDAWLTLKLALLYQDKLVQEGMEEFFYDEEVMPLYRKVTIPMEENGIKLDLDLIQKTKIELTQDMNQLEQEIISELIKIPEAQKWYNNMLIKKYPPKKGGAFGQKLVEHMGWTHLPKNASGKYSLTKKNITEYCKPCKESAFLLGNDTGVLDDDMVIEIAEQLHLEKEGALVNISSKQQMGEIVFDFMGIKPLSRTDKGAPQFNDAMIQHLEEMGYEWARKLGNYNKLKKISGSYIDRFIENSDEGYYYPYFKQHGTISGRYSSDIQQLPRPIEGDADPAVKKYTNLLRHFLITGDDRKFIICDQSSLEPRVFATVASDPSLIRVFEENEDLYSRVAIQAFKLKGVSAKKDADNFLKKIYPKQRQRSKAITLLVPYGGTVYRIAQILNIEVDEAKEIYDSYLSAFPDLKKWMDKSKKQAQYNGYVKTQTGRTRHLPKVKDLYEQYGDKLTNWKFIKKLEKQYGKKTVQGWKMDYKNGINNSRNFQIQGLAASIMNRSGIAIAEEFKEKNINAHIAMQIHDEFVIDTHESCAEEAAEIVKRCMEETVKISVPLIAEPNIADSFGEGHD
jgi:DNA polymerase I-like protein with 3'-5' exonuclease and polymerase domains